MERYLVKKARRVTDVEEDEQSGPSTSANSDEKYQRKFRMQWMENFTWLKEKNGSAYCLACEKSLVNHWTHLNLHDLKSSHKKNMENKQSQVKIQSFFSEERTTFKKQVYLAELTLVMFCINHNLPFLLMDYLPNLLAECCPDSKIAKSLQCGRTKATQITEVLGKKAQENIIKSLQKNKFSLIIDETTDVSTKKALVLIVRYVDVLTTIVHDKFLGLIELLNCDAESIFQTITEFFNKFQIPLSNMIGLATDGASVMSGEINGVQAKFKKSNDIFYLKCTCHSLHLCSAYACKKLPLEVEKLCRNIYRFFAYSPKRLTEFKEFQEYCAVAPHKILGISDTRWLALENVINRIVEQWEALKLYFISCYLEVNGTNSADLAKSLDDPENRVYFLFLSYILKNINILNKEFQSEQVRLPYLYSNLEKNYKLILSHFIKSGILQDHASSFTKIDIYDKSNYLPIQKIFIGVRAEEFLNKSEMSNVQKDKIKNQILSFYLEFLTQLKARFDFENDDLKVLSIITPAKIITEPDLPVLPLISHFKYLIECDVEVIATQWSLLQFSKSEFKFDMSINEFWEKVHCMKNGFGERCFKELTQFVYNIMSLPHSSAAAERRFSDLALIKNKLRNKLEFSSLNNIMLAKELGKGNKAANRVWSAKNEF